MRFQELTLPGAFRIDLDPIEDDRGFFARAFCQREFAEAGLPLDYPQANLSFSRRQGTLRGLHYRADGREAKLVRCIAGAVYDVIVDLRPESPTYLHWEAIELSSSNRASVLVPAGCAHGHQALTDNAELFYLMSDFYAPEWERGVRWDDPTLAVAWPETPPPVISARDCKLPYVHRPKGGDA